MRYTLDNTFFNIPNLVNSYWAGFIAADGNLYTGKNTGKILQFTLHEKDTCILEKFKEDINSSYPIRKVHYNRRKHVAIRMNISDEMWNSLHNIWNLHPKKTLTIKPPLIKNFQYQLAYIIGLIDGDGTICVCKYKNNYNKEYNRIKFSICGTNHIIKWSAKILHQLEDKKYKPFTIEKTKSDNPLYSIRCDKLRAQKLISKLLEVKVPWKLPRKWNILSDLDNTNLASRIRFNK